MKKGGSRREKVKKMFLWLLVVIGFLLVTGIIYQFGSSAKDARAYPPPGQMVAIDEKRNLHMVIKGEALEKPTVILEAGIASFSSSWYWVQEDLAADTRVVAYDRAGLGWSDPAPIAHDAYESAADLHKALQAAGINGPYVLAGHSYGGLVMRAFTDLYSDEVVGMVMVDASHPDQWAHMPVSRDGQLNAFTNRLSAWLARLGIVRLFDLGGSVGRGLPAQQEGEMRAVLNRPHSWETSGKTLAIWHKQTRVRINEAADLADRPLVVLSVTDQPVFDEVLTSLQEELPGLSTNSVHYTVEGANHEGLVADRKHALVVAAAIRQVLEAVENGPGPPRAE
ncbi:MAG: alpha/beta hydrolase [Candidatus Promineifilaceae bacterium]|nr:alpha/beta hydrolase [Candidatus Promineifilaceae bacterium]